MLPKLTVVIGAAASGKSRYAEQLVTATMRERLYIATAQGFDDEMRRKIARHKDMRGTDWHTVEAPLNAAETLAKADANHAVLLDCATIWLSNQMLEGNDLEAAGSELLASLTACLAPVVIVTNEVGAGVVPDNLLSRQFCEAHGRLNQRLAAQADLVVSVIAGLPLLLKGHLPKGFE